MKTKLILAVLASGLVLFMTGCGTPKAWYQAGTSPEQTRRDLAQCKYSAQMATRGGQIFIPGDGAAAAFLFQAGQQDGQRKEIIRDCMEAKGYELVPITQIPTNKPASPELHHE